MLKASPRTRAISPGDPESIVQGSNPGDLRENALINQMSRAIFHSTNSWPQSEDLTTCSRRSSPVMWVTWTIKETNYYLFWEPASWFSMGSDIYPIRLEASKRRLCLLNLPITQWRLHSEDWSRGVDKGGVWGSTGEWLRPTIEPLYESGHAIKHVVLKDIYGCGVGGPSN